MFFALISALTLYIRNVSNLPPKRGGGRPTPPSYAPEMTPMHTVYIHRYIDIYSGSCEYVSFKLTTVYPQAELFVDVVLLGLGRDLYM